MHPGVYADLLSSKMEQHDANAWLINTGWSGGPYGVGSRMKLKYTRAMLNAALDGDLDNVPYVIDERFGFAIPTQCPNVPNEVLQPIQTWENEEMYNDAADNLADMFVKNFKRYAPGVSEAVNASSPKSLID
jgi:phosphoenolpyruvate carboxykinase (ATP)